MLDQQRCVRWAIEDREQNARRRLREKEMQEHQDITEFNLRRINIVTDDVMEEVLRRYRVEGLFGLPARKDPTRDGDPLYPYTSVDKRAKEIIREVVIEMKGEVGAEIVREVEELEQILIRHGSITSEMLREKGLIKTNTLHVEVADDEYD